VKIAELNSKVRDTLPNVSSVYSLKKKNGVTIAPKISIPITSLYELFRFSYPQPYFAGEAINLMR
jgi:hypothetical protein